MIYRQGDVLIQKVNEKPADAEKMARTDGLVILAYGEATGHHHSFGSRLVNMYAVKDEFSSRGSGWLTVGGQGAVLRHQEHGPIKIPAGTYRVIKQREYIAGRIVNVAD
jgi:hypothetical protein